MGVQTLGYLALDAVEGSAADEQDVACIHVDVVLVGVLTASLGRYIDHRTLEQLQQSLLYAFTANVARDAGIVALACYLVYLVDEDNASLGCINVIVGHLKQAAEDALHVFAHVASLGEDRGIHDGEGHLEQFGDCAGQQRLAGSRGANHHDIALLNLHTVIGGVLHQPLVVVIDRYGEISLGIVLSYDVLVEVILYLVRLGQLLQLQVHSLSLASLREVGKQHLIGLVHALIADATAIHACQQESHFRLLTATERAVASGSFCSSCHLIPSRFCYRCGLSCHTPAPPAMSSSNRGHCQPTPCHNPYASVRR